MTRSLSQRFYYFILALAAGLALAAALGKVVWAAPEPPPRQAAPASPVFKALSHANRAIRFDHLGVDQGLSQSSVYAILQDPRGFIWFGTDEGLNRYDGTGFKLFRNDPDQPNSLSDNNILSLAGDLKGNIWVGTYGGGLERFDPSSETFSHFPYKPNQKDGPSSINVTSLVVDSKGMVWAGTAQGLDRLDPATNRFTHYYAGPEGPLLNSRINALQIDQQGRVWIGTAGGLNRFDPRTESFASFQHDPEVIESLASDYVAAIYTDVGGRVWVGTNAGLDLFEPTTSRFIHHPSGAKFPSAMPDDLISCITGDSAGNLWIGMHQNGLLRFDPATGQFSNFRNDPEDAYSLSYNEVQSIYTDRQGILWVGTSRAGVNKVSLDTLRFLHVFAHTNDPNGLGSNDIFSIYQDRRGYLWVGNAAGLDQLDPASGLFHHYRNDPTDPNTLSNDFITAIAEGLNGEIWVGTYGTGVNRFDPQTGKVTRYPYEGPDFQGLNHGVILSLLVDDHGQVWVGTAAGGLDRLDPASGIFTHFHHDPAVSSSLSANRVWALYHDRQGALWVGSSAGLDRLDLPGKLDLSQVGADARFEHFNVSRDTMNGTAGSDVLSILEDHAGNIWVGTFGSGLSRLDRQTGTFKEYRVKSGLPSDVVYAILEDYQDQLWISTNRGIARLNPYTGQIHNFDVKDGLQSNEFNTNAYFKNESGEMFFGGIRGLTIFRPDEIQSNPHIPEVELTSLTQHGAQIPVDHPAGQSRAVQLTWPDNTFEFDFASLDLTRPERNQYSYRLTPLETDWNAIGTRHSGRYTNLPGGDFTLELRAANNDGLWNYTGTQIKITVVPPFWDTWAFRILAGFVVLGLLVGGTTYRLRSVQRRNRALENQVQLRTAELERHNREMVAVVQADEQMYRYLAADQILQVLVNVAVDHMKADRSIALLWNPARTLLESHAWREFCADATRQFKTPAGQGLAGLAATGQIVTVDDTQQDTRWSQELAEIRSTMEAEGVRSCVYLPIQTGDESYGVLIVACLRPGAFGEHTCDVLGSLVQRAALSIENALLFKQTRELAVVEERARLARDLHDSAKQKAFAALAQLGAAESLVHTNPPRAGDRIGEAESLVYEVIEDLTILIQEMYPTRLKEKGLATTLREYLFEWEGRTDIRTQVRIEEVGPLALELEQALFRVTQEALANVARHSMAHQVEVCLQTCNGTVELSIVDDGQGFDPGRVPAGVGLRSMRERLATVQGSLEICSTPGHGCRLIARASCVE